MVSVSSQAHSMQSDNGCETRSIASGSSWSLLSALQLEPLSNAASGPYAVPGMLQMPPPPPAPPQDTLETVCLTEGTAARFVIDWCSTSFELLACRSCLVSRC